MKEKKRDIIQLTKNKFSETITNDFKPYGSKVTFDDIKKLPEDDFYIKISIDNNKLYVHKQKHNKTRNKVRKTILHLQSVLKNASKQGLKFPNVSFVLCMHTTGLSKEKKASHINDTPIFVLCKESMNSYGIRIPNMFHANIFVHDIKMKLKRSIAKKRKFKDRINKLYYRGGATGAGSVPRIQLVNNFGFHPNFDVGIVTKPNSAVLPKDLINNITKPIAEHTPNIYNANYMYSIHMPGSADLRGYSYGIQELLHWGCCILFWNETCFEWYYEQLIKEKLVHLCNLDNIEELSNHLVYKEQENAQEVAYKSMNFAKEHLNKDCITAYWYLALNEYSKKYESTHEKFTYFPKKEIDKENLFECIHYMFSYFFLLLNFKKGYNYLNYFIQRINTYARKKKGR